MYILYQVDLILMKYIFLCFLHALKYLWPIKYYYYLFDIIVTRTKYLSNSSICKTIIILVVQSNFVT